MEIKKDLILADSLAKSFILEDDSNSFQKNKEKLMGKLLDVNFGNEFAVACADHALNYMVDYQNGAEEVKSKSLEEATKRFAQAALLLSTDEFSDGLRHYSDRSFLDQCQSQKN